MIRYDQQRDLDTELESQKRYDKNALYFENRIENCDNAIAFLNDAQSSLQRAQDEYIFLPNIKSDQLNNLAIDIGYEILKIAIEKDDYKRQLKKINKGCDDL